MAGSLAGAPPALPRRPLHRCAVATAPLERGRGRTPSTLPHRRRRPALQGHPRAACTSPRSSFGPPVSRPLREAAHRPITRHRPDADGYSRTRAIVPGRPVSWLLPDERDSPTRDGGMTRGDCPGHGWERVGAHDQATPLATPPRSYQRAAATWRCCAALGRTSKAERRIRAQRVRSRRSQHRGRAGAAHGVPLVFAETRRHVLALHAA